MCRVLEEVCPEVSLPLTVWLTQSSDLLLRHRQKIHDREKTTTKQNRRPRSQSASMPTTETATQAAKSQAPPRTRRRRDSISVAPLPPRTSSVSSAPGALQNNQAIYMPAPGPASAPATTNNFFNFNNYPSPSASTTSTGPDILDCSMNTNYVNPADLFSVGAFPPPQNFSPPTSTSSNSSIIPPTPEFSTYAPQYSAHGENFDTMHRQSLDPSMF